MTVYGGEETDYGTRVGGFYIVCCKCGWESKVSVTPGYDGNGFAIVKFRCAQCNNEYETS